MTQLPGPLQQWTGTTYLLSLGLSHTLVVFLPYPRLLGYTKLKRWLQGTHLFSTNIFTLELNSVQLFLVFLFTHTLEEVMRFEMQRFFHLSLYDQLFLVIDRFGPLSVCITNSSIKYEYINTTVDS